MIDFLQNIVEWLENIGTYIIDFARNVASAVALVTSSVRLVIPVLGVMSSLTPIILFAVAIVSVSVVYKIVGSR